MAVIVNKNTQQTPLGVPSGAVSGIQSIKFIPAGRVYIKVNASTLAPQSDSTLATNVNAYAAFTQKSDGVTITNPLPDGGLFVDLGIMSTPGKLTYNKVQKKVQTGIDKITQLIYVESRDANLEFELDQLDDYLLARLGFVTSVITAGSSVNFQIGQEDVINTAIVIVYQNKIDGKEIQWYHPSGALTVTFNAAADALTVKVMCEMIAFQAIGSTILSLVSCTTFASTGTRVG
jgi:hypothetical protein